MHMCKCTPNFIIWKELNVFIQIKYTCFLITGKLRVLPISYDMDFGVSSIHNSLIDTIVIMAADIIFLFIVYLLIPSYPAKHIKIPYTSWSMHIDTSSL